MKCYFSNYYDECIVFKEMPNANLICDKNGYCCEKNKIKCLYYFSIEKLEGTDANDTSI